MKQRLKKSLLVFCFSICASMMYAIGHTVSITSTNATCPSVCNGGATATVSGGTGPFTYSWTPGGGTAPSISNRCSGSYTCTVTDQSDGSTATGTVTISATYTLNVTISNVIGTCNSACSGSATVAVSGGSGPYTFAWAPTGGTTPTLQNACVGTYCVTTTDAGGCYHTIPVTIPSGSSIVINTTVQNATCGNPNGSVQAVVSGGTPPYSYNWTPGNMTTATINNLPSGVYQLTVVDAMGCTQTATATVTNVPAAMVNANASPVTICQGQSSMLNCMVNGGTPPYSFSWSPAASLNNANANNPTATPTTTTTYTLLVTDGNGCVSFSSVTVVVNQAVSATVSSTDPTCNQNNGSLTVNVTQAAPPYNILWSNAQTTPTITNLGAGAYNVTVTDVNGCSLSISEGLSNIGGPSVTTTVNSTGCTNSNNGDATAVVTGIAPFTYSWNTVPAQTTQTATSLGAGSYLVTVTDSAGCVTVAPAQVNALAGNLFLYAQWSSSANCSQPTGAMYSYVAGGTGPYTYLWSNGATTPNISGVTNGSYAVTVTDNNGCTASGSSVIPSTCANMVQGRVYFDVNQDGVFNAGDYPLQGVMISATPLYGHTTTDANGIYWRSVAAAGTYDISIAGAMYFNTAAPSGGHHFATFAALGDSVTGQDFVMTTNAPFQDLYCSLASGLARPGFTQQYVVHCENRGTTNVSDTVWFRHDSILTLVSAVPAFDGYTHPQGYWVFNNFNPGNALNKVVTLQVPTIQNGGYLGRPLFSNARIEPLSADTTSPDNGDDEFDVIQGSYDPNLKECWSPTMNEYGDIWPTDLELEYTIHFQNTGTDTAFTVVVIDTLPAELDITTFRMGASSHACTYSVNGSNGVNEVKFTFMNILLPDSFVNEAASHGFVQFTIQRYPNQPIGTMILNEANNYFDFNLPVVTNTDSVIITDPLSVQPASGGDFRMYPNPANSNVTIALSPEYAGQNTVVVLRDLSGREIMRVSSNGSTLISMDVQMCAAGVYTVSIESAEHPVTTQKLIIAEK